MKARLPKGYGGQSNMQGMIKQAQKMQEDMAQKQAEIEEMQFTTSAGGGVVEVAMNGKKEITSLKLKEEVVDPTDIEMLEDLIMAAVNEVIRTVEETTNREMEKISGSLNIPGVF